MAAVSGVSMAPLACERADWRLGPLHVNSAMTNFVAQESAIGRASGLCLPNTIKGELTRKEEDQL
jgi:hypothetical protein